MKMKKVLPLTLAGAMAVVLTACNLNGVPTKTTEQEGTIEGTVKPNIGKPTVGNATGNTSGNVATNPNLATNFAKPNATVTGTLLDTKGQPIADAFVTTANGQVVKTDANGYYSIAVSAQAGKEVVLVYQKDGYVFSSQRVTMAPGETAQVDTAVKKLDTAVVSVSTAGGTFKNSTGVLEVDIPKDALTGSGTMVMTPLSFGGNGTANELPGPLETVDEKGQRLLLVPAEYWSIDLAGVDLKEGQTMTMRMKLPANPVAAAPIKAGDMIPCYIYDAALGYWNSPNLGPVVEKDGALWATYEIKASALTNRADVTRTVQHIHTGTPSNPLSDDQLMHNASHAAEGGNTFGIATAGGGVIGGHTFYNVFGTAMGGRVVDELDRPLAGASVQVRGTSADANMTTNTQGLYGTLQYRGQSARVTYSLNQYCPGSTQTLATAASNLGSFPPNQFGLRPDGQMEQRDPQTAQWPTYKFDTRHPLVLNKTGTADASSAVTYKLNGQDISEAALKAKVCSSDVDYTLEAKGGVDVGTAKTTFKIPRASTVAGSPFAVNLKFSLSAEAIK